ncbi:major outer membrane protein [Helicobacter mesocricetorum]|uniref:major outer membrane protein n=1 Tax=Helicobacter mesocricetorum TaxID=87012 RepID=UPI000CF05A6E|nr:major outer membrane protein [Helicobacter mesocricetorum]
MKFVNLSLATCVALSALSSVSLAQPLEEAIKGIDVSGMLRYRYTDDRYKDEIYTSNDRGNGGQRGSAKHGWKAEALFKTPVMNNISMNLGFYYNTSNNVNHGKGLVDNNNQTTNSFVGTGLGAGSDGQFGVREFTAVITPDTTSTTFKLGKMPILTPLNDSDDRGTGVFATNSDLSNWSFVAGAFDSWSLDDGVPSGSNSIAKPLYTLAALSNYETSIGNFGTQLWLYYAQDIADFIGFGELTWDYAMFSLAGQYAYSKLDSTGPLNTPTTTLDTMWGYKPKEANDLYTLSAGLDFSEFNIPVALNVGYWGNTQDSYAVSLDNEGAFNKAGNLWFENAATGVNISMFNVGGKNMPKGYEKNKLSAFYANINYDVLENFNVGIDYVQGANKLTRGLGDSKVSGNVDFYEISPNLTYQYSKSLQFSSYYSFLTTKADKVVVPFITGTGGSFNESTQTNKEKFNEFRVEVKYLF